MKKIDIREAGELLSGFFSGNWAIIEQPMIGHGNVLEDKEKRILYVWDFNQFWFGLFGVTDETVEQVIRYQTNKAHKEIELQYKREIFRHDVKFTALLININTERFLETLKDISSKLKNIADGTDKNK